MTIKRKLQQMNGRLFNMEKIPALNLNLKIRREYGLYNAPDTLEFHIGNNYIYIGCEKPSFRFLASPLAANGKSTEEYRCWLWERICAKDQAVRDELGKIVLATSIAHFKKIVAWPKSS